MSLPIKTSVDDIDAVIAYLKTKPTGASLKEAKAVLNSKHLDGRKLAAVKYWKLLEEGEHLKLTTMGREYASSSVEGKKAILLKVIGQVKPYSATVEHALHSKESEARQNDVAAHWHDNFASFVGATDATLKLQVGCFFHLAQAAGLGELVLGRKGKETRFPWVQDALHSFVTGEDIVNEDEPGENVNETSETEDEGGHTTEDDKIGKSDENNPLATGGLGNSIFIAHGKDKRPLEDLKKILDQFGIKYVVAIEEPNLGRPISKKVRDSMHDCNSAILIFSADEEFRDTKGGEVWRPTENVIHELGACGYLYENRIVILKDTKINMPSNFSDLGYISFEGGLAEKSLEIIKELIGFGILKVTT